MKNVFSHSIHRFLNWKNTLLMSINSLKKLGHEFGVVSIFQLFHFSILILNFIKFGSAVVHKNYEIYAYWSFLKQLIQFEKYAMECAYANRKRHINRSSRLLSYLVCAGDGDAWSDLHTWISVVQNIVIPTLITWTTILNYFLELLPTALFLWTSKQITKN